MDALVDEPASDGDEAMETSDSDFAEVDSPAAADDTWGLQQQAARDFAGSLDAALWRLASRDVPIEEGASFDDLLALRERALAADAPSEAP